MNEPTEREARLLEIIKKLITALTIEGITENRLFEIIKWRHDSLDAIELTNTWQDETLKFLEKEFDIKYTKVDDRGNIHGD